MEDFDLQKFIKERLSDDFIVEDSVLKECGKTPDEFTIPDGITKIDNMACFGLAFKSLTIPGSVKEIGDSAFSTCEFLGTLTILDGVKEIGEEAFHFNMELETVTIPGSVTKIGKGAFGECYRIAAINFGGTKEQWQAIIAAAGGSVVEDGVTVYCTDGFIADMPSYLTVEGTVLKSCQKTEKKVIIPGGITEIGERAFADCGSLGSIVIPPSVKKIGPGAFLKCTDLAKVVIPEGVTEIAMVAFGECQRLSEVTLPGTLKIIRECAFYRTGIRSITLPDGLLEIGCGAFNYCSSLKNISFPSSLKKLGGTFTDLKDIHVDEYINCAEEAARFGYSDGLVGLVGLVRDCEVLESVTLPDGITEIYDAAFMGCERLESITIPESVKRIGIYAFCDCKRLKSITLPKNVTEIGLAAFRSSGLNSISIPYGVKKIAEETFALCRWLDELTIPASVVEIEANAFYECERLKDVRFDGTKQQWQAINKGVGSFPSFGIIIHCTDGNTTPEKKSIVPWIVLLGIVVFIAKTCFLK